MSIDIDWETLTTGPEGVELAESIRDFIHDKFQQVQLPRFIRSVQVHSFNFGKESPVVELKDISDPLPEFYEDGEDSDDDHEELVEGSGVEKREANNLRRTAYTQPAIANNTVTTARPYFIDTRLPPLRSNTTLQDQAAAPFLSSRASTPGIPGGTSNFSYFHLPLSSTGLSGTQSPLVAAVTPFTPTTRHDQQTQRYQQQKLPLKRPQQQAFPDPSSRPSTGYGGPTPSAFSPLAHVKQRHHQELDAESPPADDRSQDLQTTLHISYTGSLSLSLTAEILLDYPMPSFVGIPLRLQITGLSFDGVALLAYLRQSTQPDQEGQQEGRSKIHFCFLGEEDAKAMVGANADADNARISNDGEGGHDGSKGSAGRKGGGLLKNIRVETEIGRQENGKQVLKNVGKVEKFVLEQVRRIFEEEFVWPSFWTFLI